MKQGVRLVRCLRGDTCPPFPWGDRITDALEGGPSPSTAAHNGCLGSVVLGSRCSWVPRVFSVKRKYPTETEGWGRTESPADAPVGSAQVLPNILADFVVTIYTLSLSYEQFGARRVVTLSNIRRFTFDAASMNTEHRSLQTSHAPYQETIRRPLGRRSLG